MSDKCENCCCGNKNEQKEKLLKAIKKVRE